MRPEWQHAVRDQGDPARKSVLAAWARISFTQHLQQLLLKALPNGEWTYRTPEVWL